jgi:hypothetical protein
LTAAVSAFHSHSDGAEKQLAVYEEKLGGLNKAQMEINRVASELRQLINSKETSPLSRK